MAGLAPNAALEAGVLAVASSGGRDSTALLHCTLRVAAPLGLRVIALHVHHGLMPDADAWLAQVRKQARRWGAGFLHRRLADKPGPGDSIEAWARRARYLALAEMAQEAGCGLVLLAHHRRDQAETVLLQALRGGGPAGLSAMPRVAQRAGIAWARPWLDMPRARIDAYVQRHRLSVVDDASNSDARFARSRLRQQVWPALTQAFPDAEVSLAGAASHAQQAAALAVEVAALDLPPLRQGRSLDVAAWAALPAARRRNALHAWLTLEVDGSVPHSLVDRLLIELPGRSSARWPAGTGALRLYRGLLEMRAQPGSGPVQQALPPPAALDLSHPGRHLLPAWGGAFVITPVATGGVAADLLRSVQARARTGGERFSLALGALPRSLKKQFQAQGVPAWQRDGPLLHSMADAQASLLFVPGLGTDARLAARPGTPRVGIVWQPDADASSRKPAQTPTR